MFALYFDAPSGKREFITAVNSLSLAQRLAHFTSRTNARRVLIVENSQAGDTILRGIYLQGEEVAQHGDGAPDPHIASQSGKDGPGARK